MNGLPPNNLWLSALVAALALALLIMPSSERRQAPRRRRETIVWLIAHTLDKLPLLVALALALFLLSACDMNTRCHIDQAMTALVMR